MRKVITTTLGVGIVALMGGAVHAQSTGSGALEEIVVTAQKRSENLQDVPIAVSVVTGTQLEKIGVLDIVGLKAAVPALNLATNGGYLAVSLRGIGTNGFGPGFENPIALYVDGVYYASALASVLTLNNIDQIEVLKGPQGTLFGRNATGGLIQITTKTPTDQTTGDFNISYGNYNTVSGNGYISGQVASNLFMNLAVTATTQGEGWGRDLYDGSDVYKTDHDILARWKIVFEPSPLAKFTVILDYSDNKDVGPGYTVYPGTISALVPSGVSPDWGYDVYSPLHDLDDVMNGGASLKWDQKIADLDFMSLTAYRDTKSQFAIDLDSTAEDLYPFFQYDRQFSQELQLSSKSGEKLTWLLGAYYINSQSQYDPLVVDAYASGAIVTINNTERAKSSAGYAQATYEIFDRTNLTLGGRYTTEKRSEVDASEGVFVIPISLQLPTTVYPDQSVTYDKFTYRVSLDHRFSDQLLAYASVNTGFKSGGFNASSPGSAPYSPETLKAYEVGVKTDLLDRRVRLNAAVFYYDYKDIQVQTLVNSLADVINGASARVTGLDTDFAIQVTPKLSLTGGLAWINATFTSFVNCPYSTPLGGTPVEETGTSCADKELPYASKVAGNIGGDYTSNLGSGSLDANANLYYSSGFHTEADNVIRQPSYPLLNASVRYTLKSRFSISAFGRNLTNERVISDEGTFADGTHLGYWQSPRTYGIGFGYKF